MSSRLKLGINIDHVATIRNARGGLHPDPLKAALIAQNSGADNITIHPEATEDLDASIKEIKSYNKKPGVSLNPETHVDKVLPVLDKID